MREKQAAARVGEIFRQSRRTINWKRKNLNRNQADGTLQPPGGRRFVSIPENPMTMPAQWRFRKSPAPPEWRGFTLVELL
ncbi:MAG TPA: hypothetical protein VFB80_12735, partial [Pirellulaceae bacterium]|nr:hypothetical protein [Pirellulaceae bacterium]